MWARRCGAPPTWPSKVKVFLFSLGTGAIGLAIYTFMANSNVGYLDLSQPSAKPVLCLNQWPLYNELFSWFDQENWDEWFAYQSTGVAYLSKRHSACRVQSLVNVTCASVSVPLSKLIRPLGSPLQLEPQGNRPRDLLHVFSSRDILGIYALLFLVLSVGLWLAISFHDQALLHSTNKDYILDAIGLRHYFPRFERAVHYFMGWHVLRNLLSCRSRYLRVILVPLVVILAPLLLIWRFLTFMFIVCPLASLIFLCYPIRTSRLWTFLICVASAVYGVCLTAHMLYFLRAPEYRQRYAVTWQVGPCICGCTYPVSQTTCGRLLMIGLLASVKASVIAFRTLKGLRRSNWANLLSVTFPVPVNAYSVEWTQPDGKPINNRKAGDAVQSELAFDPFALMDEQPESAKTHVNLRPSGVLRREVDRRSGIMKYRLASKRHLLGPNVPNLHALELEEVEQVGCCGFPFRTGGLRGRWELPKMESTESFCDVQGARSLRGSRSGFSTEEPKETPSRTPEDSTPTSAVSSPTSTAEATPPEVDPAPVGLKPRGATSAPHVRLPSSEPRGMAAAARAPTPSGSEPSVAFEWLLPNRGAGLSSADLDPDDRGNVHAV